MAKKQKIVMLEKIYHTYEVEADTIEEGVDKLGEYWTHGQTYQRRSRTTQYRVGV